MKTAILFPGQGTQFAGMGKALYEGSSLAKEMFTRADEVFGDKLSEICFNGPDDRLKQTRYQQAAIYAVSAVAFELFKQREGYLRPSYFAGLSLGEYTALYAAGAVSFENGLLLVKKRAELMQLAGENNPSTMLAVIGADKEDLVDLDGKELYIANLNCPGQVVASVANDKAEKVKDLLVGRGFKRVVQLEVSGGFHSPFMKMAEEGLENAIKSTAFNNAEVPVICNIDAQPYTDSIVLKRNIVKQLTGSVLWHRSVEYMKANRVEKFYEIGPGNVLKGILRKIDKALDVENIAV